jgi:hypothetical protein
MDLIRTMVDKEGDLELLKMISQLPRRKELGSDPFYRNILK